MSNTLNYIMKKLFIIIGIILFLMVGCGQEDTITKPEDPIIPQINVKVPEEISVIQPLDVRVLTESNIVVSVSSATVYRSSKIGYSYMYLRGTITNNTDSVLLKPKSIGIWVNKKKLTIMWRVFPLKVALNETKVFGLITSDYPQNITNDYDLVIKYK